jgi:hypothetical protein
VRRTNSSVVSDVFDSADAVIDKASQPAVLRIVPVLSPRRRD